MFSQAEVEAWVVSANRTTIEVVECPHNPIADWLIFAGRELVADGDFGFN